MQESLLSHITSNFITQYENVANSGMSYLLSKYSSARKVLQHILEIDPIPNNYITELSTNLNGRPDITGVDETGNKMVIIEGKFWANLTDNQPVNYLKELSKNGKLLFLAPDKRLHSLSLEIGKKLRAKDPRIELCSWVHFLNLIEIENNKNPDYQLASDLMQLKELCIKMDEEGMPPLSSSDLDPMNARLPYQFVNIIDECNQSLRVCKDFDFTGLKSTSTKYGYGFYFKGYDFSCNLYYSSKEWLIKDAHTPIWLSIQDENWKKNDQYYYFLNSENAYNETYSVLYAIVLKKGMDKHDIVKHITNEVKHVLADLRSKV